MYFYVHLNYFYVHLNYFYVRLKFKLFRIGRNKWFYGVNWIFRQFLSKTVEKLISSCSIFQFFAEGGWFNIESTYTVMYTVILDFFIWSVVFELNFDLNISGSLINLQIDLYEILIMDKERGISLLSHQTILRSVYNITKKASNIHNFVIQFF